MQEKWCTIRKKQKGLFQCCLEESLFVAAVIAYMAHKSMKTKFYALKETYDRVMEDWGDNLEFMCEWVVALNQKIWQHYDDNQTLARVYDELWRKADEYCCKHFKDDELSAYYSYIDYNSFFF